MCMQTSAENILPQSLTLAEKPRRRRKRSKKTTPDGYTTSSGDSSNGESPQLSTEAPTTKSRSKPKRRRRRSRKSGNNSSKNEERSLYVALDCEMVGVGEGGQTSAVARVCLVNWDEEVLLDTFVKVAEPVTNYRTFVSGIREEDLASDEAIDFDECRMKLASLIAGKILVGHALKNDLRALQLHHPWYDIRDTAKYEPFMKLCETTGIYRQRRLRDLVKEKLRRTIQLDGEEHSPHEDAVAALDLFKHAKTKWEKVMQYKVLKTREIKGIKLQ